MRIGRDETGASAVEFAIVAPLVLFVALGLIDIGRYSFQADALSTGVERALRVAMVSSGSASVPASQSSLQQVVNDYAYTENDEPAVTVVWSNNTNAVGETVTVTAVQPITYFSPLVTPLAPSEITVTSSLIISH